ncbi:MAG: alkaline phosphatase [Victivallales bacterium]|nr:alkaline phosphatase [Victivallales bacterium]
MTMLINYMKLHFALECSFSADFSLRHVFLFIGDGMGEIQIHATQEAFAESPDDKLSFQKFPVKGWQRTASANAKITDSAAAATAMACGFRTNNGMLGMDPDGNAVPPITSIAHQNGWKIGIISSVSLDHATPAGFYAHDESRGNYGAIAQMLADSLFEFFGGGGLSGQKGLDSKEDNLQRAIRKGFTVARTREQLESLPKGSRILAMNHRLVGGASLPWAIESKPDDIRLAEFTAAAVKQLSGSPFFIMVEGGKIDWACHDNDLLNTVYDTRDFDAAVQVAVDFLAENPDDTLIVVTADHETGGLKKLDTGDPSVMGSIRIKHGLQEELKKLKVLKADTSKILDTVKEYGLGNLSEDEEKQIAKAWSQDISGEENKNLYGNLSPVLLESRRIVAARAGFKYTSFDHTAVDVPVFAIGKGAENFSGTYDNTEIPRRLLNLMGLGP